MTIWFYALKIVWMMSPILLLGLIVYWTWQRLSLIEISMKCVAFFIALTLVMGMPLGHIEKTYPADIASFNKQVAESGGGRK
ncbi:hypothetical protein IC620_15960 [Hazenella sp. IB182357]|uniref:Uncharacterized protein n=1 Tax=Polycladospora coralii TaxID=2771432 RepID=A0A926NDJ5_9BACL|nr:hypothetical protein [Polycladospora coralii]MBD1373840.1 hypothetical protein [Polycladospora coralii]